MAQQQLEPVGKCKFGFGESGRCSSSPAFFFFYPPRFISSQSF
jgi:hypothetical protein